MNDDNKLKNTDDKISKKERKSKKKLIFIIVIGIIIGVVATLLLINSIGTTNENRINFNEKGNVDYKVYLKENEFYDEPFLKSGMSYVATLIDKITVDFNYQFNMNQQKTVTFYYNIDAELKITDTTETNVLYTKTFDVLDVQSISTEDASSFNINKEADIDYNYYNEIAQSFKNKYGIDTVSTLVVNLRVQKLSDVEYSDFDKEKNVSIKIPLTQKAINVTLLSTDVENSKEIIYSGKTTIINKPLFLISVALYVIDLIFIFIIVRTILIIIPRKSPYAKNINKILKTYDRLIVNVSSKPKFNEYEIIKITDFDELIDIRDNLKLPIMYYSIKDDKKCIFYIEHGNKAYILSFINNELEMI